MMIKVCDKCGEHIPSLSAFSTVRAPGVVIDKGISTKRYDLCRNCLCEIERMLKSKTIGGGDDERVED